MCDILSFWVCIVFCLCMESMCMWFIFVVLCDMCMCDCVCCMMIDGLVLW